MKILSLITHSHVIKKPVRPLLIFGTQIYTNIFDEIQQLCESA